MSDAALVRAERLTRIFEPDLESAPAVFEATFKIVPRDQIALTGPSGSGKSTLLHLVAGIDSATSGTIEWPALGPPETLRPDSVGIAFQGESLLPALTVAENVALPLVLKGAPEDEAADAAADLLERFSLADVAGKLPEEISGGQSQRAAVARALIAKPRLVLADEPTGQQDRAGAERIVDELIAAVEETDAALVIATHDLAIAARFALVWSMAGGRVEQEAPLRS